MIATARSSASASGGPSGAATSAPPAANVPRHVQHCYHAERSPRDWWFHLWRPDRPDSVIRAPYQCGSWRCPVCARHEAAVTFARIKEACDPLPSDGWVFVVLTIDRHGYYSGAPWPDAQAAYRALSRMSAEFLRRVRRLQARHGWTDTQNRWVATVEAHRSGWPHLNLVMYAPEMARELEREREARRRAGMSDRESRLMSGELSDCATSVGWGVQSTAEKVRDAEAMAGYVTKLARHADAHVGELAKLTQAPLNAPVRFRRLRSGKGFLPPRRATEYTGVLVRRVLRQGQPDARPMSPPRRLADEPTDAWSARCALIDGALQLEAALWERERLREHYAPRVRRLLGGYNPRGAVVQRFPELPDSERLGDLLAARMARCAGGDSDDHEPHAMSVPSSASVDASLFPSRLTHHSQRAVDSSSRAHVSSGAPLRWVRE